MLSLVSIVMPMYNSEAYVLEAIKSVIAQTHNNWELIVVDDGSTDSSIKIVNKLSTQDHRIKLFKNKHNLGAAISRNKAIEAAKGDVIAFLDADDKWLSHKLETQLNVLNTTNTDVCFSSYEQIDETGDSCGVLIEALSELSYNKLLKSNYIGNLTGVYNVKNLGKVISPNLRKRQDWLLWLKVLQTSKKSATGIKESLALYRVHEASISSNKISLLKYNYWVYKKGLGYSTLKSIRAMIIFLNEHFFVKSKQIKRDF
jgi:glycosyltransferase involved in cell wall biosynthesis